MRLSLTVVPLACLPLLLQCSSTSEKGTDAEQVVQPEEEPRLAAPPSPRYGAAPLPPPGSAARPDARALAGAKEGVPVLPSAAKQPAPAEEPIFANLPGLADEDVQMLHADTAPTTGPADAPVSFVVFTDYQCAWCAKLEQRLRVIRPDYPTQLKVIWRNLPLPMHENARAAARAALAASEQGRFGEFTRLLFTNQNKLGDDDFERYASGAGLDVYRFREAASSDRLEQLAEADLALAKRFGVTGTPTSFINGRRINGARQEAVLRRLIDDALADAQQP